MLNTALTPQTRFLFGKKEFALMRRGAGLVNMYLKPPGLREEGSLKPTQDGMFLHFTEAAAAVKVPAKSSVFVTSRPAFERLPVRPTSMPFNIG